MLKRTLIGIGWLWILAGAIVGAQAQDSSLLLSTSGDAATLSGAFPDIDDEEVLIYAPPFSSEPANFVNDFAWEAARGDVNGNGLFDDEPGEVDAMYVPSDAPARPTIFDVWLSFSATERFLGEGTAEDGDIVRLLPGGGLEIVHEEAFFEVATGTSSIDVDAFTVTSAGDMFFSFADNEETTYDPLIQENGGSSTLLDGTILVVRSGEMLAHVYATEEQVLEMVRAALNVSNTSIGDTQGLAEDPGNPDELFFAVSSTASQIEGTVFSTAGGGTVATLNGGFELHGATIGFDTEEVLDALAVVAWMKDPLSIEMDSADIPPGDAADIEVRILRGTPNGEVRLLASPTMLPILPPVPDPILSGVGMYFVDIESNLFRNCWIRDKYKVALDAEGNGAFRHPSRPIPPGVQRIIQIIDLATMEISDAVVVEAVSEP